MGFRDEEILGLVGVDDMGWNILDHVPGRVRSVRTAGSCSHFVMMRMYIQVLSSGLHFGTASCEGFGKNNERF